MRRLSVYTEGILEVGFPHRYFDPARLRTRYWKMLNRPGGHSRRMAQQFPKYCGWPDYPAREMPFRTMGFGKLLCATDPAHSADRCIVGIGSLPGVRLLEAPLLEVFATLPGGEKCAWQLVKVRCQP